MKHRGLWKTEETEKIYGIILEIYELYYYNIARVLALYKSYWAAMNKIFIYALFLLFIIWKKPAKNSPIFLSALTF